MSDINNDKEDIAASVEDGDYGSELDRLEIIDGISAFNLPMVDLEAWRERYPCTMKLYGADSLFDDSEYGQVKWYWYVAEREEAIAFPYEALIYGYGGEQDDLGFPDNNRYVINQYFTESEIEQFREYLIGGPDAPFYDFHVIEVDLPISLPVWTPDPWSSDGDRTMYLYDIEGYSLPFKIAGHAFIPEAAGYFLCKAGGMTWKSEKEIYGK